MFLPETGGLGRLEGWGRAGPDFPAVVSVVPARCCLRWGVYGWGWVGPVRPSPRSKGPPPSSQVAPKGKSYSIMSEFR